MLINPRVGAVDLQQQIKVHILLKGKAVKEDGPGRPNFTVPSLKFCSLSVFREGYVTISWLLYLEFFLISKSFFFSFFNYSVPLKCTCLSDRNISLVLTFHFFLLGKLRKCCSTFNTFSILENLTFCHFSHRYFIT